MAIIENRVICECGHTFDAHVSAGDVCKYPGCSCRQNSANLSVADFNVLCDSLTYPSLDDQLTEVQSRINAIKAEVAKLPGVVNVHLALSVVVDADTFAKLPDPAIDLTATHGSPFIYKYAGAGMRCDLDQPDAK